MCNIAPKQLGFVTDRYTKYGKCWRAKDISWVLFPFSVQVSKSLESTRVAQYVQTRPPFRHISALSLFPPSFSFLAEAIFVDRRWRKHARAVGEQSLPAINIRVYSRRRREIPGLEWKSRAFLKGVIRVHTQCMCLKSKKNLT